MDVMQKSDCCVHLVTEILLHTVSLSMFRVNKAQDSSRTRRRVFTSVMPGPQTIKVYEAIFPEVKLNVMLLIYYQHNLCCVHSLRFKKSLINNFCILIDFTQPKIAGWKKSWVSVCCLTQKMVNLVTLTLLYI